MSLAECNDLTDSQIEMLMRPASQVGQPAGVIKFKTIAEAQAYKARLQAARGIRP